MLKPTPGSRPSLALVPRPPALLTFACSPERHCAPKVARVSLATLVDLRRALSGAERCELERLGLVLDDLIGAAEEGSWAI